LIRMSFKVCDMYVRHHGIAQGLSRSVSYARSLSPPEAWYTDL